MKKVEILKNAVGFAASLGVGVIVENAVKATTPVGIGKIGKILVLLGSVVLSSACGDLASKYTDSEIDNGVEALNNITSNKE